MESKLIGKEVKITTKDSWAYGEWGIVKYFDGDLYHVALYNDPMILLVFERSEIRVKRGY